MAIKKSDEKKLKSIESKFYLEALGSENFSIGDYGLDRRRLGRALGKILRKYGTWFNTSDRYCFMIVNHMEDSGLIRATADKFVVVDNWRELVQKMFPKETLNEKRAESVVKTVPEETVQDSSVQSVPDPTPQKVIEVGSLKNNYEFYQVLLENMGEDFKTQGELRNLVSELYLKNFGEKHSPQFFYNRLGFLQAHKLLESIEDEGVVKHLRAKNYKEILDSRKKFLTRDPFKFNNDTAVQESNVNQEKEAEVTTIVESKPEPTVIEEKKKKETVCVCIDTKDLNKLYETDVLFNDGHMCVLLLETIPANLDVLKNIKAEADPESQNQLWEKLADQRNYYLVELAKIERLCGREV